MHGQRILSRLVFIALVFFLKVCTIKSARDRACEIRINIDEDLFIKYQKNIDNITRLVAAHVKGLNAIYGKTVFIHSRDHDYSRFYFRVNNIIVMPNFDYKRSKQHFGYLTQFTKYNSSGVCLSVIFTLHDFPNGIQGLAWRNTVCENTYNTGFITFINHGRFTPEKDSVMTFAHEVAHSFGAKHNERTSCGKTDESHGYIMSESGTNSREPQFSQCSLREMNRRMKDMLTGKKKHLDCFVDRPMDDIPPSFCGNGIVEDGEECDCGLDHKYCNDVCCYSGLLSPEEVLLGDKIRTHEVHGVQPLPCHKHSGDRCVRPWVSAVTFALILPFAVIFSISLLLSVVLCCDWRRSKVLYVHVTHPKDLIRSETGVQLGRREEREANKLKGALLPQQETTHTVPMPSKPKKKSHPVPTVPPHPAPPPPSIRPPPPPPIYRPPPPPPTSKPSNFVKTSSTKPSNDSARETKLENGSMQKAIGMLETKHTIGSAQEAKHKNGSVKTAIGMLQTKHANGFAQETKHEKVSAEKDKQENGSVLETKKANGSAQEMKLDNGSAQEMKHDNGSARETKHSTSSAQ